jgi:hypothetical protein
MTAPKYYNNTTNNSIASKPTLFSLNWTDNYGLAGYIFSTNNSGTWQNESWTRFNTTNLTFGSTNIESTKDTNDGYIRAYEFTLPENAIITSITSHFILDSGTPEGRVAIYSDSSGHPYAVIVESSSETITETGWHVFDITDTYLSSGTYWLAQQFENGASIYRGSKAGQGYEFKAYTYDVFMDPLSGATDWDDWIIGIYANYTPTPNESWSNVTKTLNTTVDLPIGWRVYANDTANNWNASEIFSLITTDSGQCQVMINNQTIPYTISQSNTVYCLAENVGWNGLNGTIFDLGVQNSTLDCRGYNINSNDTTNTYGVSIYRDSSTDTYITIKNCNITDYEKGINLVNTNKNNVTNCTLGSNAYGLSMVLF